MRLQPPPYASFHGAVQEVGGPACPPPAPMDKTISRRLSGTTSSLAKASAMGEAADPNKLIEAMSESGSGQAGSHNPWMWSHSLTAVRPMPACLPVWCCCCGGGGAGAGHVLEASDPSIAAHFLTVMRQTLRILNGGTGEPAATWVRRQGATAHLLLRCSDMTRQSASRPARASACSTNLRLTPLSCVAAPLLVCLPASLRPTLCRCPRCACLRS